MTGADQPPLGRPTVLGDEVRHYWLVQRMARATGTDLVAATRQGDLDQKTWAGMVQRCRGCDWASECQRWLDCPDEAPRATPETCQNRKMFQRLQAKLRG